MYKHNIIMFKFKTINYTHLYGVGTNKLPNNNNNLKMNVTTHDFQI